jgi:heme A synthase
MDEQVEVRKHICIQCDKEALKDSDSCEACETKEFQKIGGWLYLPALGLLVTLVLSMLAINNTTRALLQFGSNFSTKGLWVVNFELLGFIAQFLLTVYVGSLFLRKKRQLPKAYIAFLLYGLVFVGVDLSLAHALMGIPLSYDSMHSVIRTIFACCIWIPYFRVSERVKRTFVN